VPVVASKTVLALHQGEAALSHPMTKQQYEAVRGREQPTHPKLQDVRTRIFSRVRWCDPGPERSSPRSHRSSATPPQLRSRWRAAIIDVVRGRTEHQRALAMLERLARSAAPHEASARPDVRHNTARRISSFRSARAQSGSRLIVDGEPRQLVFEHDVLGHAANHEIAQTAECFEHRGLALDILTQQQRFGATSPSLLGRAANPQ